MSEPTQRMIEWSTAKGIHKYLCTAPHDANGYVMHVDRHTPVAKAAIEALREGAVERVRGFEYSSMRMGVKPIAEQYIDAILGPKEGA